MNPKAIRNHEKATNTCKETESDGYVPRFCIVLRLSGRHGVSIVFVGYVDIATTAAEGYFAIADSDATA